MTDFDSILAATMGAYKEAVLSNIFTESPIIARMRNSPEVQKRRKVVRDVYGGYRQLWDLRDAIDLLNGVKRDMWGDEEDD